jgi:branched-chain amino acid aminotransferase
VRKYLIDGFKSSGFECIEKPIDIAELLEADEVFLTNSIYNIRWVSSIGNKRFGNTITQKIYAELIPTIL